MPKYSAKDFEYGELPEDTPHLCEIVEIEEGKQDPRYVPEGKEPGDQLIVRMEIVEGEFKGERIRAWLNATFGPKSSLVKLVCAAMNVEWSKDLAVDTDDLIGKRLYVIGDYGEDGKATYLRPRKYKPATNEGPGRRRGGRAEATE